VAIQAGMDVGPVCDRPVGNRVYAEGALVTADAE
jgi:hypothetical protein